VDVSSNYPPHQGIGICSNFFSDLMITQFGHSVYIYIFQSIHSKPIDLSMGKSCNTEC